MWVLTNSLGVLRSGYDCPQNIYSGWPASVVQIRAVPGPEEVSTYEGSGGLPGVPEVSRGACCAVEVHPVTTPDLMAA